MRAKHYCPGNDKSGLLDGGQVRALDVTAASTAFALPITVSAEMFSNGQGFRTRVLSGSYYGLWATWISASAPKISAFHIPSEAL